MNEYAQNTLNKILKELTIFRGLTQLKWIIEQYTSKSYKTRKGKHLKSEYRKKLIKVRIEVNEMETSRIIKKRLKH